AVACASDCVMLSSKHVAQRTLNQMNHFLPAVRRAVALPCLVWMCHVSPVKPIKAQPYAFSTTTTVILIISIALSVAAAAASYVAQQQAAENQARSQRQMVEAQNETIRQNSALANAAYINDTKQLQNRQAEEAAAAAAREHGVQIEAAKTVSTAATAAGEAGVSGLSVNALLTDYTRQEVDYRFQSQTQLENQRNQTEA